MKARRFAFAAGVCALATLAAAAAAPADVKISDQAYVRHDGGTDSTIVRCSTDNRQQNEPAVGGDPTNSTLMTAGANHYCTSPTTGDVWAGFYYSSHGGQSLTDSLVPGYSTDTSTAGMQSPAFGIGAAGDPAQGRGNPGPLYSRVLPLYPRQPAQ